MIEALLALGGLYRGQRRFDEATRVYTALEQLGDVQVAGGQPAGLVARQGRLKTFLEAGDRARVRDEAIGLGHALRKGEWSIDRATFENPHQFPVGIDYVIVNGVLTLEHERHTGALAGRVIYGPGKK